ncbi:MAG: putative O-glycosylation ligase, exosortase A system-associated [Magnetococcales bacterium]|nr:putative O-glycosylation ligase, exosortase A system-associated [Magnetococcales bacterium]
MRDIALLLFVFALVPVALFRPYVGLLLWTWFSYMNPHRLTWGFAYNFRFNLIVAAITIISILINRRMGDYKVPWKLPTILLGVFTLWTYLTTQFALQINAAEVQFDRFIKIQFLIFASLILIKTRRQFLMIILIITISIGFYGVKGGLFTLRSGGHFRVMGPADSFFVDNNSFALAMLMTIPLIYFLTSQTKNLYLRIILIASFLLSFIAVLGSYSRGGVLGLIILSFTLLVKTRSRFILLIIFVSSMPVIYQFMPQHWHNRMNHVFESAMQTLNNQMPEQQKDILQATMGQSYQNNLNFTPSSTNNKSIDTSLLQFMMQSDVEIIHDKSVTGRFDAWRFSINVANDRPILGGGFKVYDQGAFDRYLPGVQRRAAHSIYFEVLAEQGYTGFFIWLSMHISALMSGRRIARLTRRDPELLWARELAGMLQVSLISYYTAGIFLGMAYFDLPYHIIALLVLLQAHVEKHLDKRIPLQAPARASAWELSRLSLATASVRR